MEKRYDVILVGAGPTGIFAAYELMLKAPHLKVVLIDKGHDIYNRKCPILEKKIKQCPVKKDGSSSCAPACSMTSGFGGCGAYSDGKFNITNEFGGWMGEYLPEEEVLDLINYVDAINLKHGAPKETTDPNAKEVYEFEKLGISHGLKLLRSKVRHLGTEINLQVLTNIFEEMRGKIDYLFKTDVTEIIVEDNQVKGVQTNTGDTIYGEYVLVATEENVVNYLENISVKMGNAGGYQRYNVDIAKINGEDVMFLKYPSGERNRMDFSLKDNKIDSITLNVIEDDPLLI